MQKYIYFTRYMTVRYRYIPSIFFYYFLLIILFTFWYFHVTSIEFTVRHVAVIDQQPMFPLYVWYPFLYGFFDQFFSLQALVSQQIFQKRNYTSIIYVSICIYISRYTYTVDQTNRSIWKLIGKYPHVVKILIAQMISPLKIFHEMFIQFFLSLE